MRFYLAPLEGITGYIYRNRIEEQFGDGVDKYFTPFVTPHRKRTSSAKEHRELLPENNKGLYLVPQVLTNQAEECLAFEEQMHDLGYREININLGCPSGTVVSKGKGAGFLRDPDSLDRFLEEVFSHKTGPISLKTRLGMFGPEEFSELLEVYNQYPLEELILHPRVMKEQYSGVPHLDRFLYALRKSSNPLCYNGDICSAADLNRLTDAVEEEKLEWKNPAVMIGRGMIANPALIRELSGGKRLEKEELLLFLTKLEKEYRQAFSGDMPVLFKMKEIWAYMIRLFPDCGRELKALRKSKHLSDYEAAVKNIMSCNLS